MPMTGRPTVLFVCPDNAGTSLMAEAIALHGHRGLRPFSAAALVPGAVDPALIDCLEAARVPADGLSAKPAGVFSLSGAPRLDVVVALGAQAWRALRRQTFIGLLRFEFWQLPEVAPGEGLAARRTAYRTLMPDLDGAIGRLEERIALRMARAAA
ncbi:hypothetical protein V5F32_13170 [Xanthobacter oligotrophicus]|uniref:Phosphotyrosine protein phosphatase I domain-containing protein n=1 Tax=Xanthobacter oligotrophicus TaxID=2607286 RepID=A0ABW6ZWK4_9HYPH